MEYISPKEAVLKVKRWPKDTIAAGRRHTVGLKSDGTVTAVGDNKYAIMLEGRYQCQEYPNNGSFLAFLYLICSTLEVPFVKMSLLYN